jgi:hypothetical protein
MPIENDVYRHALTAKAGPDRAGQDLEILDDQHSHDVSPFHFLRLGARSSSAVSRDDIGPTMT